MPAKRELTMRQIRHMLRLAYDGVSAREIGRRLGAARSTIQDGLKRATAAGLVWPLAEDLTDEALEQRLFARAGVARGARRRIELSTVTQSGPRFCIQKGPRWRRRHERERARRRGRVGLR